MITGLLYILNSSLLRDDLLILGFFVDKRIFRCYTNCNRKGVNTLNERIKKLRKELNLTQREFAAKIGMKQNSIAIIESGRNTSDQTIMAICREFNVREEWLRSGAGDMFIQMTRDERIAAWVGETLSTESDTFQKRFISMLSKLSESDWEVLERMVEEMKKVNRHAHP